MKKNISWQVLIIIGLAGSIVGRLIEGVAGNAVGVLGDICLLIGIANMIVAFVKNRRLKKAKEKDAVKNLQIENADGKEKQDLNYKKYLGYISYAVIIILVVFIIFLLSKGKNSNNSRVIKQNNQELSSKKSDGSFDFETFGENETENQKNIDEYAVEILQIGGVGSRMTQATAYLLSDQSYLKPAEDWVNVSFNSPADIMDLNCKDGFDITACIGNGKNSYVDDILGCRTFLKDETKNTVRIECKK